jgi:LacI family transcriptional regulator
VSKPRSTLSDIAGTLGVSVAAVSNALSGKGRISDDLALRIRAVARDLGYVPSVAGRALRTGRSGVLGLVLADLAHPLFPQIARAIEQAASERGYGVLIGNAGGDVRAQAGAIARLIERGADGVIVVPMHGTRVGRLGHPVAVIDSPSTPGNTVASDHFDAGRHIGRHMGQLGHRRLALIGAHADSVVQNDRIAGIRAGLGAGARTQVIWIAEVEQGRGPGAALGLADLAAAGVTGFMGLSDLNALRALSELQRAGLRVPQDASVTGFDDLLWSRDLSPALTTMRMDAAAIAAIAVDRLVQQIDQIDQTADAGALPPPGMPPAMPHGVAVPMRLIVRHSSGPAPDPAPPPALRPDLSQSDRTEGTQIHA